MNNEILCGGCGKVYPLWIADDAKPADCSECGTQIEQRHVEEQEVPPQLSGGGGKGRAMWIVGGLSALVVVGLSAMVVLMFVLCGGGGGAYFYTMTKPVAGPDGENLIAKDSAYVDEGKGNIPDKGGDDPPDANPLLSFQSSPDKRPGKDVKAVTVKADAETNYDLPPPDNIDPDDPLAMEKVEQDREIAEELQQDFDTNNPNLPDIDSVKKRINEATGTNKTILARDPRVRKQIVSREGGTSATEAAVARGLAWLAKHQSPNGNWSLHKFHDSPGCTCDNPGKVITDMGATSLALLPFLGAGQTHIVGKYKDHVREGINYLLDNQIRDGDLSFGARGNTRMYTHGQATIVLCEALMMTGDRRLRNPAQEAVNFIVKSQHSAGGWRYQPGEPGDTSVVAWPVMALQSARAAGLIVPSQTLNKANQYLDQAQSPNSLYGYMPGVSFTYVMTAEALLCRFYLGYNQKSPGVEYGINYLVENHLPAKPPFNMYYMYYGTQLMHHYGGQPWKTWNAQMQDLLIASQKTNGHRAGSWTPVESHDSSGGRLYTTAMAVCCLEVYYRHLPIFRKLDLE
jgi:hypothetical protein